MGTRHLVAVQKNNEYRVAQYGQWDGYPSGQGLTVLEFLRSVDLKHFGLKVQSAQWIDEDQLLQLWETAGAPKGSAFVPMPVSDKFNELYPHLHRNCGAEVLEYVLGAPQGIQLTNSIDFAEDALFCEWAYVIDLDNKKLEVYSGTGEDNERFPRLKLHRSWKLSALPDDKDFLKELDG